MCKGNGDSKGDANVDDAAAIEAVAAVAFVDQHAHAQHAHDLQRWPEDHDHESAATARRFIVRIWNNWTYSYMNAILKKGANQNKALKAIANSATANSAGSAGKNKKKNNNNNNDNIIENSSSSEEIIDDGNNNNNNNSSNNDVHHHHHHHHHLTSDDLYPVPRQMESSKLVHKFESNWQKQQLQQQQQLQLQQQRDQLQQEQEQEAEQQTTKMMLLKTLWTIAAPTYIPAGIFQLVAVLCISTMPLIVRQLLFVLERSNSENNDNDNDNNNNDNTTIAEGLKWSLLLTFMTLVNGFTTQRYRHQAIKTGVALRSAVVNIIYQHALTLSPHGKTYRGNNLTSGEINNLVAVDAQKLYEVTQEGHLIWALPLSIGLATWFLCIVLGPSTLVGIGVLVAFLPIIKIVTKQMTTVRAHRLLLSDERVDITVSMLLGMRTTKLNGYESKYQHRIEDVRTRELAYLAKEQAWWATTLLMTVSSPVLATGATFATYVLLTTTTTTSDDDEHELPHILTAADTFGVLLLFGALRFPINFAGQLIGKAAQAWSAIRRISVFLQRPLRTTSSSSVNNNESSSPLLLLSEEGSNNNKNDDDNDDNNDEIPLILTNARFRVGVVPEDNNNNNNNNNDQEEDNDKNDNEETNTNTNNNIETGNNSINNNNNTNQSSFTVGDFNFELRKGQVMVVCGPVGAGKSTLINGILEEAEAIKSYDNNNDNDNDNDTNNNNQIHKIDDMQNDATATATAAAKSTATTAMVQKRGRISYAPQDPFILNLSLRENILFGTTFDPQHYNRVLDACALRPDIEQLGGSDSIQIGERGVTLSGGQRQRVSLARAAYAYAYNKQSSSSTSSSSCSSSSSSSSCPCVILDDPFSALDSGTGKIVFERLIAAPDALLKDAAVLLVTHASHFISHRAVDTVLLMVNGRNQFLGSWEELTTFNNNNNSEGKIRLDEHTRRAVDHIQSQVRENTNDDNDNDNDNNAKEISFNKKDSNNNNNDNNNDKDDSIKETTSINEAKERQGQLQQNKDPQQQQQQKQKDSKIMQKELREHGLSSMKTWLLWFQRAGGAWFGGTIIILMAIDRFAYVAVEWFLALWATGAYEPVMILGVEFPPQTDGLSAQLQYLKVFAGLIAVSIVSTAFRSEFAVTGGVRATKNVFNSMLGSVLRAPMSYFETVPMGRILNRFTYDTDVNDVTLTQVISMFIISCSWYVASIVVQVAILPWSALALFPVSGLYLVFMHYYRMTGPDLQRIDALSRSPMQSMVSECLEGSTSIRIFHQDANFIRKFQRLVDVNSSALLNYVSVQRWLSVRMEVLGSLVVLITTVLVVCLNESLQTTAGLAGLLITWSSNFTITLNFLVQTFSETEAAITAIERVDAMAELPTERPMETASEFEPPKEWPEQGLLEFRGVSLRYREGLPLALNNLSFKVPAGKTCGIVGRTGAGKSSITVALFRLVEIESNGGQILLDDIDLMTLGLSDVRGRGMSIIPQDPFLAGANLRECLDPFELRTDEEIMEALQSVRMGGGNSSTGATTTTTTTTTTAATATNSNNNNNTEFTEYLLSTKLEEGGSNYSVGERQLLNLARALLSQPKVLVLDEATASIDGETDAFIQKMLRTRFPNTTLVTIAHRLNTVMDYDYVLVMDGGRAAEFDAPAKLLEKKKKKNDNDDDDDNDDDNNDGIFSQLVDATGIESSKALRQMAIESWTLKNK